MVEPLRFRAEDHSFHDQLAGAHTLEIAYRGEDPPGQGGVFSGPLWPEIRVDDVRIFALRYREDGTLGLWFESGQGAVPPAHSSLAKELHAADAVEFLEREVANAFASGDAATVHAMGRYATLGLLHPRHPDQMRPTLLTFLAELLGSDLARTRTAAAAMLASQGIPRASWPDFLAGRGVEGHAPSAILELQRWVVLRLPEGDRERLLIETLLGDLPVYSWGAAMTLAEFADHPALEAPLAAAIERQPGGILFVLATLIRNGRRDLAPSALDIVRELLDHPEVPLGRWRVAARLLWDHGDGEDLERFLLLVRRSRQHDADLYSTLWSAASDHESAPRLPMLRFLAIYLRDSRAMTTGARYSDLAAGRLAELSGDRFGLPENKWFGEISVAVRDAAIERASEWLAAELAGAPR